MKIRRCVNCMENLENVSGEICPHCGFDNSGKSDPQPHYAMRWNTILHGRYLVGKVLGKGGFGITYIGFDLVLNIKVAIKEYFPMEYATRENGASNILCWNSRNDMEQKQSGYDSFLKEARKTAKIDQIPAIVRVRDTFYENDTAYIIMDYVEGTTLKDKLLKEGRMTFSECVRLLTPMMEGLKEVHGLGMIHRDISPDNIMVQPDGSVKLLDLGAAKDMTINQGQASQLVTKKGFSPMEQYAETGKIGPWTDVYALCATIYYCITGKTVPSAPDRIDSPELSFPADMKEPLSESVIAALKAGLAVDARNRTQSVDELLRELDGAMPKPQPKLRPKQKWMIAILAVLLLGAGIFAITKTADLFQPGPIWNMAYAEVSDFQYVESEDGEGIVITGYTGLETEFSIPGRIKKKPVVGIAENAFAGSAVRKVGMPDSVKYIGDEAFHDCSNLTFVGLSNNLEEIGDCAFQGSHLTNMVLPESLVTIGQLAFSGTWLSKVHIPANVSSIGAGAFTVSYEAGLSEFTVDPDNPNFETVEGVLYTSPALTLIQYPSGNTNKQYLIPDGTSEIEMWAFTFCWNLSDVKIPESVHKIGYGVFWDTYLKDIVVSKKCELPDLLSNKNEMEVRYYADVSDLQYAESGDGIVITGYTGSETRFVIPGTIERKPVVGIAERAFAESAVAEVVLPDSVKYIGDEAFHNCSDLAFIDLSDNLEEIGGGAFYNCPLMNIDFPESLVTIGNLAFSGTMLSKVHIPANVSGIGAGAFSVFRASGLSEFTVDPDNPNFEAVEGVLYTSPALTLIQYPSGNTNKQYLIPEGTLEIEMWAFTFCQNLLDVKIPESVRKIGYGAFWETQLKDIVVSEKCELPDLLSNTNELEVRYY